MEEKVPEYKVKFKKAIKYLEYTASRLRLVGRDSMPTHVMDAMFKSAYQLNESAMRLRVQADMHGRVVLDVYWWNNDRQDNPLIMIDTVDNKSWFVNPGIGIARETIVWALAMAVKDTGKRLSESEYKMIPATIPQALSIYEWMFVDPMSIDKAKAEWIVRMPNPQHTARS